MKTLTRTIATAVIMALVTLTSTFADEIALSFERDMNRQATAESETSLRRDIDLPTQQAVNQVIWSGNESEIVASFYRDMDREPTPRHDVSLNAVKEDPLVPIFRAALAGEYVTKLAQKD
ncbi:MAG: hypothetical protein OEY67_01550 [Gammaproteobacteria bacterium]|nr:hypothetical protein [Gammaproteobacteria bacterium]